VSVTEYIIDIGLIAIVVRQMRARAMTLQSLLLPVVLLAWACSEYLRGFAVGGNDVLLIVLFTLFGIVLGLASGLCTRVWASSTGQAIAQAGWWAAFFWIAGMGFRFFFILWTDSASGGQSITNFSYHHSITSSQAWVTALLLMAVGEVLARIAVLRIRGYLLTSRATPAAATS